MHYDLWHGTNQDFARFERAHLGMHTANDASREAFFFAMRFETAQDYAKAAARKMVPDAAGHDARVRVLLEDADRAMRAGQEARYERLVLEAEELEAEAIQAPPAGAVVLGCRAHLDRPMVIDGMDARVLRDLGDVILKARAAGHDGLVIRNIHDTPSGAGAPDDHVAVFDPDRIEIVLRVPVAPEREIEAPAEVMPSPA